KTVLLAQNLSDKRKAVAKDFEIKVKSELEFLDMPKLQFVVDFSKGKLSSTGFDKIEFLISTNPGEPPKPLSKIASGGELSRIMLAIKNILSYNDTIGTLIFDEIDTGVSGRASQKIGLKLKAVSKNTQVICVTHSAQIASNADSHFLIQKKFEYDKTFTKVTPLDFEARKYELARIMGGLEITDTLLNSAEELLKASQ
ncbi:MAG: DNA repair protein RecN, partial [Eubacterium sp.]|nr:DNA repair protein RecN [Eubacterium sp.]